MRKALMFVASLLVAEDTLLSHFKRQILEIDEKRAKVEAKKLERSWINPIKMSYTYQKGDQFPNQLFESFTVTLDQPIFKSGGIWEAVKYAKASRGESLAKIERQRNELIANLYRLLFEYKKLLFTIEKESLALRNAKLDVKIKEEAYIRGDLDSSFLDNAILKKNSLALRLLDLKRSLAQTKRSIKDLSAKEPDEIPLPHFKLLSKEEFLKDNLQLRTLQKNLRAKKHFKNMTIARYLPSISIFASYNYQKMKGSQFIPSFSYMDHFYTYGLRASMPLFDINALSDIESKKLDLLKAKVSAKEERFLLGNLYAQKLHSLALVDKKIELTKEDRDLYKRLLESTKEGYAAGEKTSYDVEIMRNSLEQKRIDLKIFEIERQQILLDLYKELQGAF